MSLYKSDDVYFPSMERALANEGIDPITRVFPAQIGEVLEIIIQNTGADANGLDAHPFHAHGLHYYDIGAGNGTYNATENEAKLASLGHTPVMRDTTMLYRYGMTIKNGTLAGWRGWRLRVEQPGAWMIHCHILQHMIMLVSINLKFLERPYTYKNLGECRLFGFLAMRQSSWREFLLLKLRVISHMAAAYMETRATTRVWFISRTMRHGPKISRTRDEIELVNVNVASGERRCVVWPTHRYKSLWYVTKVFE